MSVEQSKLTEPLVYYHEQFIGYCADAFGVTGGNYRHQLIGILQYLRF
jgi:hypothetical protein